MRFHNGVAQVVENKQIQLRIRASHPQKERRDRRQNRAHVYDQVQTRRSNQRQNKRKSEELDGESDPFFAPQKRIPPKGWRQQYEVISQSQDNQFSNTPPHNSVPLKEDDDIHVCLFTCLHFQKKKVDYFMFNKVLSLLKKKKIVFYPFFINDPIQCFLLFYKGW